MTDQPDQPAGKKQRRIDPDKIPPRAWQAADYLRGQVLAQNAASFLGTKPWSAEAKTGARLTWANSFRLLHDQTLKAMRNADAATTADAAWDEIARSVHWLFHKQPPGEVRFVVESPESLRAKWDRITTARKNRSTAAPRGADGRPENVTRRQWKSGDEWGTK